MPPHRAGWCARRAATSHAVRGHEPGCVPFAAAVRAHPLPPSSTAFGAHSLSPARQGLPPRRRPSEHCPSSPPRRPARLSVRRAKVELSSGSAPGEAWMEPALNCIETGMATDLRRRSKVARRRSACGARSKSTAAPGSSYAMASITAPGGARVAAIASGRATGVALASLTAAVLCRQRVTLFTFGETSFSLAKQQIR